MLATGAWKPAILLDLAGLVEGASCMTAGGSGGRRVVRDSWRVWWKARRAWARGSQAMTQVTNGPVVYTDASGRFASPFRDMLVNPHLQELGVFVVRAGGTVGTHTHPQTLYRLGRNATNQEVFDSPMTSARQILLSNTVEVHRDILIPWLRCVNDIKCMRPIGFVDKGCSTNLPHKKGAYHCLRAEHEHSILATVLSKLWNVTMAYAQVPPPPPQVRIHSRVVKVEPPIPPYLKSDFGRYLCQAFPGEREEAAGWCDPANRGLLTGNTVHVIPRECKKLQKIVLGHPLPIDNMPVNNQARIKG
ncbi:hypothetical protein CYMTET_20825 [Cymbomonas tetramitiformis]|uniref:Uncharacterized protein n=1 Tax=Cymbomonas tetramitiformis TaxID=36881 RepID=A0AAE0G3B0_9CHLO|nr:hypothetical protein CYMTET_20825 [Cymbomonas tetramitiformis]